MSEKPVRPSQTSLSGWLVVLGSVFVVLGAFERVATLGSIESQQAAADALDRAPSTGFDLSVDDVQLALHVMAVVAGGLATLTGAAGWLVLRRSREARVVLSVAAPLLVLAGLGVSPFAAMLVAAATVMLWVQPSRAWLAGQPVPVPAGAGDGRAERQVERPAETPAERPAEPVQTPGPPHPPAPGPSGTMSAMTYNPGSESYPPPPQYGGGNPYGGSGAPTKRPGTVTAAAIITMVFGALTTLGCGILGLTLLLADKSDVINDLQDRLGDQSTFDDYSFEDWENVLSAAGIIFLVLAVWALISIALAVGAMRGSNGARIMLIISAGVSIVVSLVGTLIFLFPGLNLIAAIAVIVLLFTGGAGDWYRAKKNARA
ncbi:hypothetical protein GCM10023340_40680 [Nocardioides marinquilinus]|uniref:DUF4064 domain-containing protein n=1 Tax=Nocardioides marinquilinus TaxID=1210400 RepID=A0ABP9Q2J7_9ACTN